MALEAGRTDYGMTNKGQVVVIEKQSYDDTGENLISTYEVRHGVRTVKEGLSKTAAETLARALAR